MQMLSEDDRDLQGLSDDELALAWDLWFDLAQATNDADPPYTHGVFQMVGGFDARLDDSPCPAGPTGDQEIRSIRKTLSRKERSGGRQDEGGRRP